MLHKTAFEFRIPGLKKRENPTKRATSLATLSTPFAVMEGQLRPTEDHCLGSPPSWWTTGGWSIVSPGVAHG